MDKTELGRAGELAMAMYSIVSSDGELQLFTAVADDDHVDATAGRRGGMPAIAIQVKTAREIDRGGLVEARQITQPVTYVSTLRLSMRCSCCRRSRWSPFG